MGNDPYSLPGSKKREGGEGAAAEGEVQATNAGGKRVSALMLYLEQKWTGKLDGGSDPRRTPRQVEHMPPSVTFVSNQKLADSIYVPKVMVTQLLAQNQPSYGASRCRAVLLTISLCCWFSYRCILAEMCGNNADLSS